MNVEPQSVAYCSKAALNSSLQVMDAEKEPKTMLASTILIILYPIISAIGTVGNIVAFIVFSRPRFRRTIFFYYFRVNLIVDLFVILNASIDFLNYQFNINVENFTIFLCNSRQYSVYFMAAFSSWLNVVIIFYRMTDVLYPTSFLFKHLPHFQLGVCFTLFVATGILYLPIAVVFSNYDAGGDVNSNSSAEFIQDNNSTPITFTVAECHVKFQKWLVWMDLFYSTVIPFVLMTFFIAVTLTHMLRRSAISASNHTNASTITPISSIMAKKINNRSIREKKYGMVVISIDVCFLIFNLPTCVAGFMIDPSSSSASGVLAYSTNLNWYVNYGSIFFVNFAVNTMFRAQLYNMLSRKREPSRIRSPSMF